MFGTWYRAARHGLKVRLSYRQNRAAAEDLRRQVVRGNPGRKIVGVILLEHLGDIVACEPVARYLKGRTPDAFIVWGVKRAYRELIESNPHVDASLAVHCLTERLLLEQSGVFDEVIDLHFPDRYCSLCRNPLMKRRGGSGIDLTNYFDHGSLLSAMSLGAGLPALDESPRVYIPEAAVKKVDRLHLPEIFITINCTSNAPEKGWTTEKWLQLLEKIMKEYGLSVFEIGTETCINETHSLSQSLCGKLSILESAEVIRRAKLFIGIDSGPAHLANAVQTQGIIIIGSYLGFNKYMPYSGFYDTGNGAEIVYSDNYASDVPVDEVFTAVMRKLGD